MTRQEKDLSEDLVIDLSEDLVIGKSYVVRIKSFLEERVSLEAKYLGRIDSDKRIYRVFEDENNYFVLKESAMELENDKIFYRERGGHIQSKISKSLEQTLNKIQELKK